MRVKEYMEVAKETSYSDIQEGDYVIVTQMGDWAIGKVSDKGLSEERLGIIGFNYRMYKEYYTLAFICSIYKITEEQFKEFAICEVSNIVDSIKKIE